MSEFSRHIKDIRENLGPRSVVDGLAARQASAPDRYITLAEGTKAGFTVKVGKDYRKISGKVTLSDSTEVQTRSLSASASERGTDEVLFNPDSATRRVLNAQIRNEQSILATRTPKEDGSDYIASEGVVTYSELVAMQATTKPLWEQLSSEEARLAQEILSSKADLLRRNGINLEDVQEVLLSTRAKTQPGIIDLRRGGALEVKSGGHEEPHFQTWADHQKKLDQLGAQITQDVTGQTGAEARYDIKEVKGNKEVTRTWREHTMEPPQPNEEDDVRIHASDEQVRIQMPGGLGFEMDTKRSEGTADSPFTAPDPTITDLEKQFGNDPDKTS